MFGESMALNYRIKSTMISSDLRVFHWTETVGYLLIKSLCKQVSYMS